MTTDKQKAILRKAGYNDVAIANMGSAEVSNVIGEFLAGNKPKTETIKPSQFASKPKTYDTSSYYVAYAKDLCVAMIQAQSKEAKEQVTLMNLMQASCAAIKQAQNEFKN